MSEPTPAYGNTEDTRLDAEVARYREAIRRNTLCEKCLAANPPGSKFCADCGRSL